MIKISVQEQPFDPAKLFGAIHDSNLSIGAVVTFTGYVRDFNEDKTIKSLFLQHYPGMTEKALNAIAIEASQRWPIEAIQIYHRVGQLGQGDPIVFIAAASAHRKDAFQACEFLIDYLKTRAPFWKKEETAEGFHWVQGRDSDQDAADRWAQDD